MGISFVLLPVFLLYAGCQLSTLLSLSLFICCTEKPMKLEGIQRFVYVFMSCNTYIQLLYERYSMSPSLHKRESGLEGMWHDSCCLPPQQQQNRCLAIVICQCDTYCCKAQTLTELLLLPPLFIVLVLLVHQKVRAHTIVLLLYQLCTETKCFK